jgi:hypothetical protein
MPQHKKYTNPTTIRIERSVLDSLEETIPLKRGDSWNSAVAKLILEVKKCREKTENEN